MILKHILDHIAEEFDVSPREIRSRRRFRRISVARQAFFWCARQNTKCSLPTIGRFLGFDHSTVLHGVRKTDERIAAGDLVVPEPPPMTRLVIYSIEEVKEPAPPPPLPKPVVPRRPAPRSPKSPAQMARDWEREAIACLEREWSRKRMGANG